MNVTYKDTEGLDLKEHFLLDVKIGSTSYYRLDVSAFTSHTTPR